MNEIKRKAKKLMVEKKIFEEIAEGLIVRLKIIPNASKNEVVFQDGMLKFRITAQPIENKANKALVEFISKAIRVPKSNISIVKGDLNKEKMLLIKGIDEECFKSGLKID